MMIAELCHDESDGLSILDEERGAAEAIHVEYLDGRCDIILYDRVHHALAIAKRAAMRQGGAARLLGAVERQHGRRQDLKNPKLHFVDFEGEKYSARSTNPGCTLNLPRREVPDAATVRGADPDPEHALWDTMTPCSSLSQRLCSPAAELNAPGWHRSERDENGDMHELLAHWPRVRRTRRGAQTPRHAWRPDLFGLTNAPMARCSSPPRIVTVHKAQHPNPTGGHPSPGHSRTPSAKYRSPTAVTHASVEHA
ncbi:MAG: hypothetical protein IPH72_32315 [Sandaracinaceae bacterium]|nr:hypothetical protein [Sandaracinaceae bacterium]